MASKDTIRWIYEDLSAAGFTGIVYQPEFAWIVAVIEHEADVQGFNPESPFDNPPLRVEDGRVAVPPGSSEHKVFIIGFDQSTWTEVQPAEGSNDENIVLPRQTSGPLFVRVNFLHEDGSYTRQYYLEDRIVIPEYAPADAA